VRRAAHINFVAVSHASLCITITVGKLSNVWVSKTIVEQVGYQSSVVPVFPASHGDDSSTVICVA
jgi:hypothetical protein